jgi:hypothetical protein
VKGAAAPFAFSTIDHWESIMAKAKTTEQFISKLGTTKAGHRSRIWLQGKRLVKAGFQAGFEYGAIWSKGALVLDLHSKKQDEVRKVSGSTESPIIDIVGEKIKQTFGAWGTHVAVSYELGKITIKLAPKAK